MRVHAALDSARVISARGYSTKLGGAPLPDAVLDAMREAASACVRMDLLQEAAGRLIAEVTGAESGLVASGASAALTLGTAACLAGMDVDRMNRLPDTTGMPDEVVVHRSHRNDYDHAVRAAGARFVEVGYSYLTHPYEVEQAITPRTAALYWQAGGDGVAVPLAEFCAIAHRHGKPVIVDAAAELPPAAHLRSFIEQGADLVAFSGGKHLRGPQATGILCGRAALVASAALQHQDMDVFPETWPLRTLQGPGRLAGPPHHGIGRGFKVGKEEIAGLMAALELYRVRDFDAERRGWTADLDRILTAVRGVPGIAAELRPASDGRPVPRLEVAVDPAVAGVDATALVIRLQEGDPPIHVFERFAGAGRLVFHPEALAAGDADRIAVRLREILAG